MILFQSLAFFALALGGTPESETQAIAERYIAALVSEDLEQASTMHAAEILIENSDSATEDSLGDLSDYLQACEVVQYRPWRGMLGDTFADIVNVDLDCGDQKRHILSIQFKNLEISDVRFGSFLPPLMPVPSSDYSATASGEPN